MKIQQIRNATLKIDYAGQTILVDPWLQDRGTGFSAQAVKADMVGKRNPLNDLPMAPEQVLHGVDFCLVTHFHPDHFTEDYLPKTMKLIVQNEYDRQSALAMGFADVIAVGDDPLRIGSVTVTKVPAIHGDSERVVEHMGCASGYILNGEDEALYIAGDTVYCPSVERVLKSRKPDVIVLNCCEATTPDGRLIMGLSDVEAVCEIAPEALVIATHLDSVNHALLTSDDVRDFAQRHGLTQLLVPQNGEVVETLSERETGQRNTAP